jgi:hypothetical protein
MTFFWTEGVRLKQLKHLKHTLATYVYNHYNICNIGSTFAAFKWNICNIYLKHMKHIVANMCSSTCCHPMQLVDAVQGSAARDVGGARCEARTGARAWGANGARLEAWAGCVAWGARLVWLEARGAGARDTRRVRRDVREARACDARWVHPIRMNGRPEGIIIGKKNLFPSSNLILICCL